MHLQTPYKGNNLTNDQKAFNTAMSKVRVSVEWVFGEIAGYFAFIDFKKKIKKLDCSKLEQCTLLVLY